MAPAGGSARQIGGFERHADCHLERTHMKEHKKRSPAEPVAAAGGGGEAEGEGVLGPTADAPAAATGGAGVAFDPKLHEAVTTGPAADPAQDHTVGAVLQAGYQLAGALIRPARVVVLKWSGASAP